MSQERREANTNPSQQSETSVIWILWLTYGAFYFCRTNISAAVAADPGLETPVSDGGLGLTSIQIGLILGSLKIAYGIGQVVNGQLSEHVSPRKLLAVGMLGSAALNVLFGLSTGFYFLLFVWACNGYCQSLGWTPCMRVAAHRIPPVRRGRAIGLIGTGYQITLGVTYLVAGWSAQVLGWRGALVIPAGLLLVSAVFMLVCLQDPPRPMSEHADSPSPKRLDSVLENILLTLGNPTLWLLGLSLGLLNACRYGFLDWGLKHLTEVQGSGVGRAALKYAVLPLGAVAGAFLAGWATDHFFRGRRAPVICFLLLCLGGCTLIYDPVARASSLATMFLLVLIGFCIYGPQVLLVGTAPADLARQGTAAAAAGFVNFLGYMGAFSGDVATAYLRQEYGWKFTIFIWAGWAFAAAAITALLWNVAATGKRVAET